MKKICFVTTISMTLKAFVIDTAKYLHEEGGYDITFICDYDESLKSSLPDYINYIPIQMKRGISISGIKATLDIYKIFSKEKFDIIQYSTPNASFYASIASKLTCTPVRLYCQWGIVYVGFNGFKRKIFKMIEKIVCSFSTWIEPDSIGNLRFGHLEGLYGQNKSSVVWNGSAGGVNLRKFDISYKNIWREEIRNKYNINEDTFVMGFIGRITRDKGINELLQACKAFFDERPNSTLILVGDKESHENINYELYQWSINEKRVIYCGRTTEVEKYIASMDIFILPSYREGFGSVVIEAEAMGVPIIVTNIPGPTEAMVANETGLIVERGSSLSLLTAIKKIASDNKMLCAMSEKGVSYVKNKFDQDILFQKILQDRDMLLKKVKNGDDNACQK